MPTEALAEEVEQVDDAKSMTIIGQATATPMSVTRYALILARCLSALETFGELLEEADKPKKGKGKEAKSQREAEIGMLLLKRQPEFLLDAILLAYIATAPEDELVEANETALTLRKASQKWGCGKTVQEQMDAFSQGVTEFFTAHKARDFEVKPEGHVPNATTRSG